MSDSAVRITTGTLQFRGVDSSRVPLIASAAAPDGLKPGFMPLANNCRFDNGTIAPRPGIEYLTTLPVTGKFNDAFLYEPAGEFPYLVSFIAGRVFRTRVDLPGNPTDEITQGNLNPPDLDLGFSVQGEEFLIHQCGDATTLPLFWDGTTMRRSRGPSTILGVINAADVVPAVGSAVILTLTAPFAGANGDTVYVNGQRFTASTTVPGSWITLRNDSNAGGGLTQTTGATVRKLGATQTVIQSEFVIPVIASSIKVPVFPAFPLGTPTTVGITNDTQAFTVLDTIAPALTANQIALINVSATPGDPIAPGDTIESDGELPAGLAMDYYMGRVWIANGREYLAGDIVGGPSGTAAYGFRDSILKMTENAFTVSGGAFIVPSQAGNIRALKHPANIDTSLGEGQLLPMTRRNIYSTNVTPTRAEWALLTEPIQRVAQINFGTVSDRSVVTVNADLYYQAVDGVRSFKQGRRDVETGPGSTPISQEEQRVLNLNDRSLLRWATGVEFETRLLQSALPYTTPVGTAHKATIPLNFVPLNTMSDKLPPAWEGVWEGVPYLKLLKGDFGGRQRCFLIVWSELNQAIEVWEQTNDALEDKIAPAQVDPAIPDSEHARITWSWESPAFDWSDPFALKELDSLELWVDRLSGWVDFYLEWRPDQFPCWQYWNRWQECAARNECELINPVIPCDHPQQVFPPEYRATMVMPKPPIDCNAIMKRPMNIGYTFQFRLTVKGQARVRGLLVHAFPRQKQAYHGLVCPS